MPRPDSPASSYVLAVPEGPSCASHRSVDFFVGQTTGNEYEELAIVQDSKNANELDDKVILIHDFNGKVIGCGLVNDVVMVPTLFDPQVNQAVSDRLCGQCADCGAESNPMCNDSCQFTGKGSTRPYSLYLKMEFEDKHFNKITVNFDVPSTADLITSTGKKKGQSMTPCQTTVKKDKSTGLFRIARPQYCNNGEEADDASGKIGNLIYIDYIGDEEPDLVIDTSSSMPIYAGMRLHSFLIEGYCLGKGEDEDDEYDCTHLDEKSSNTCSVGMQHHF